MKQLISTYIKNVLCKEVQEDRQLHDKQVNLYPFTIISLQAKEIVKIHLKVNFWK